MTAQRARAYGRALRLARSPQAALGAHELERLVLAADTLLFAHHWDAIDVQIVLLDVHRLAESLRDRAPGSLADELLYQLELAGPVEQPVLAAA